jgi:hypothetical protein
MNSTTALFFTTASMRAWVSSVMVSILRLLRS